MTLSAKLKDPRTNWKYILIVVILAFLAGGGIFSYQQWIVEKEFKVTEVKIPVKERIREVDIGKCLPSEYKIENVQDEKRFDLNNDGKEERILTIEKEKLPELGSCSQTFIISLEGAECKLEWQSEYSCSYGSSSSIQDLNQNVIPDLLIEHGFLRGFQITIVEWNGKNYEVLFNEYSNQTFGRKVKHFGDLNNDAKVEIITAEYAIYHIPSPSKPSVMEDLYFYHVYKWNGEKYVEATSEFFNVYDEDIKLARELLEVPGYREEISHYLERISKLKKTSE